MTMHVKLWIVYKWEVYCSGPYLELDYNEGKHFFSVKRRCKRYEGKKIEMLTIYSLQCLRMALPPLILVDPTVENWRPAQWHSVNDSENAVRLHASMGTSVWPP